MATRSQFVKNGMHNLPVTGNNPLPAKPSFSPESSPHSILSDFARTQSSVSPKDVDCKALAKIVFRIGSYPIAEFY